MNRPASPSSTVAAHSRGRQQGQPVLGQRCRRPELAAGLHARGRAAIAQPQQPGPVAGRTAGVDEAHQPVEVDVVDQPVERIVAVGITLIPGATGSGGRSVGGEHAGAHEAAAPVLQGVDLVVVEQGGDVDRNSVGDAAPRARSSGGRDRLTGELPDHGAQLEAGAKHRPLSIAHTRPSGEQAVPALAVGVVGEDVEARRSSRNWSWRSGTSARASVK